MLRLLIIGISGTPIFETAERLSQFHNIPFLTFEINPYDGDSYFSDKIPEIRLDTNDMRAGSGSANMERDPGKMEKVKMLDRDKAVVLPYQSISDIELQSISQIDQGICVTQIPDTRLIDWSTHVCFLNCSDKNAIRWFSQRLKCPSCGNTHHLEDMPPKMYGICDRCGTDLIQQDEDRPEYIKQQFLEWRNLFWRFEMLSKRDGKFRAFAVDKFSSLEDLISRVNMSYRGHIERRDWYHRNLGEVDGSGVGPLDIDIQIGMD